MGVNVGADVDRPEVLTAWYAVLPAAASARAARHRRPTPVQLAASPRAAAGARPHQQPDAGRNTTTPGSGQEKPSG
ncbi:hypothetical protein H9638_06420 [Arthrobacter sp. Sa2BUA2]|uniref:Uncharacterized protein n=1 Tax=Arthrobacter pullicola TaxID=2762224 RepID=A0ABR8YGV3_9MICC|nr:hypothetical protein [Arthrobacter pullicola]MBD8043444.1 hypothetical protein [Arthrobacter pullicola]